jgi:hypothetical protein
VVAVGQPGFCDEPEDCERPHLGVCGTPVTQEVAVNGLRAKGYRPTHPFYTKAGDWVLIAPRSLTEGPDDKTYFCAMDDVICVLAP